MSKRNFGLELIHGQRTYIPPPNACIVKLLDMDKTKGGILTPDGPTMDGQVTPLGKVEVLGGCAGEFWEEPPCLVGDHIQFSPQLGLISDIHDGWCVVPYDCINLTIQMGAHEGLVWEPEEGETTVTLGPQSLDVGLTLQ